MSIKIDLMPRYVALQRRLRNLALLAGALLAGTAAVLGLIYVKGENDLAVMNQQLADATEVANRTTTARGATATATSTALPLESFVQFVVNAGQTGAQRAALIDLVKRYISPNAVVSQIDMSDGLNAKITATLRTPDDYARFLLDLRRGSATNGGALFAENPTLSVAPQNGLPGTGFSRFALPQRGAQPVVVTYPITMIVVGRLKDPVVTPPEPGAAPTATSSLGGPPGGFPGGPPPGVGGPPGGFPGGPPAGPPGGVGGPPSGPPTGPPT